MKLEIVQMDFFWLCREFKSIFFVSLFNFFKIKMPNVAGHSDAIGFIEEQPKVH